MSVAAGRQPPPTGEALDVRRNIAADGTLLVDGEYALIVVRP